MRMNSKLLLAFGVGFIATAGATLAQSYGRGRNVQFVDGAAISPSSVTTSGAVTAGSVVSTGDITLNTGGDSRICLNGPTCTNRLSMTQSSNFIDIWSNNTAVWSGTPSFLYVYKNLQVQNGINHYGASGTTAFNCTNVGCRLSLGNTGRYFVDNGSVVEYVGSVLQASSFQGNLTSGGTTEVRGNSGITGVSIRAANAASTTIANFVHDTTTRASVDSSGNYSGNGFIATTASGSALTGGGASGPLLLTSDSPDSVTSTTVPAVRIRSSQALNAGDGMFQLLNSSNTNLFQVTAGGETQVNGIRLTGNILQGGTSDFVIYGQRAATSTVAGTRIGNATQPTVDGGKLASIVYFSGGSWVDAAHFSKEGLLRVNAANAAKPTCNADNRGRIFFLDGAAGVADIAEICGKDAANVYAWKAIATF